MFLVYCWNDSNVNTRVYMGLVAKMVIGFYVVGMIWIAYEAYNAPTYPDDYDKDRPN